MTRPDRIADGMYWDRAASWIEGCTPVSAGCRHCWSAAATHMRAAQTSPAIRARYGGLAEKGPDGPRFCGRVRTMEADLAKPLHTRKSTTWAVWNDFFHPDVPDEFRDRAMAVMALCPQHTFLILTKRAKRMPKYFEHVQLSMRGWWHEEVGYLVQRLQGGTGEGWKDADGSPEIAKAWTAMRKHYYPNADPTVLGDTSCAAPWPLPNVRFGVTVENADHLDRLDYLMQTPAAVRYVSLEPLLGPIRIPQSAIRNGLDWVIVGGETGPDARPMHPDWARGIRDQCASAGVPFFFKHWGGPNKAAGRLLDGRTHDAIPEAGKGGE